MAGSTVWRGSCFGTAVSDGLDNISPRAQVRGRPRPRCASALLIEMIGTAGSRFQRRERGGGPVKARILRRRRVCELTSRVSVGASRCGSDFGLRWVGAASWFTQDAASSSALGRSVKRCFAPCSPGGKPSGSRCEWMASVVYAQATGSPWQHGSSDGEQGARDKGLQLGGFSASREIVWPDYGPGQVADEW